MTLVSSRDSDRHFRGAESAAALEIAVVVVVTSVLPGDRTFILILADSQANFWPASNVIVAHTIMQLQHVARSPAYYRVRIIITV